MPNIKSAKKRVKVIATKTLRNKAINTALKTDIKKQTLHLKIKTQIQLRLLKLQSEQLIKLLQRYSS